MSDGFGGAHEPRAELAAGRAHLQVGEDGLAATDAAGDEHRNLAQLRQDFLGKDVGRDRPDMAAGLGALDDQPVDAVADQPPRQTDGRRETHDLAVAVLDRA